MFRLLCIIAGAALGALWLSGEWTLFTEAIQAQDAEGLSQAVEQAFIRSRQGQIGAIGGAAFGWVASFVLGWLASGDYDDDYDGFDSDAGDADDE